MRYEELENDVLLGQKSKPRNELWIAALILLLALAAGGAIWYCHGGSEYIENILEPNIYVGGVAYDKDISEITLSGSDIEDYSVLTEFKNLQKADLRGQNISAQQYDEISNMLDGVEILWSVPFNGGRYSCNIESLTLTPDVSASELEMIKYFTSLRSIRAENYPLCDELYDVMQQANVSDSDCEFTCASQIYGVNIDSSTEKLILSKIKISDLNELKNAVRFFPKLTEIEMCECGLSDETMGTLREEYPQIKFVWTVKFLYYTVRTDALVFSTLVDEGDPFTGNQEDFAPLFRYCTELRALDLGHHQITDISEIVNLKKLQVLILADNKIEDISPLAELKELNYVELFFNRFTDVSPLAELERLEDLNLCFNRRITNPTELAKCPKLNRLYISKCGLTANEISVLRDGLPKGCEINTWVSNAVNEGWRSNAKNRAIRRAFYRWRRVIAYEDWANVTYK